MRKKKTMAVSNFPIQTDDPRLGREKNGIASPRQLNGPDTIKSQR